jgi:hypothetical protein
MRVRTVLKKKHLIKPDGADRCRQPTVLLDLVICKTVLVRFFRAKNDKTRRDFSRRVLPFQFGLLAVDPTGQSQRR